MNLWVMVTSRRGVFHHQLVTNQSKDRVTRRTLIAAFIPPAMTMRISFKCHVAYRLYLRCNQYKQGDKSIDIPGIDEFGRQLDCNGTSIEVSEAKHGRHSGIDR